MLALNIRHFHNQSFLSHQKVLRRSRTKSICDTNFSFSYTTSFTMLLYYTPDSPPCQAVLLVIKQLGLDVKLRNVDLVNNEHLTPDFRRMNPLHQVPTLDDNGFFVGDSHAIISYLAANTILTSSDARITARINQMLLFDFELFRVMGEIAVPLYYETVVEPSQKALKLLLERIDALESLLERRNWVTGEFLTVADFSVFATFSAIFFCPIDLSKFVHTLEWYEKCKRTFAGYPAIKEDSENALGSFLKSKGIELKLKTKEAPIVHIE